LRSSTARTGGGYSWETSRGGFCVVCLAGVASSRLDGRYSCLDLYVEFLAELGSSRLGGA
jgi:hypothetical protein